MMAIGLTVALTVVDVAEARRSGGGFGSRGTRTFSQPPVTRTAPTNAAPIDRSMTPRQDAGPTTTNPAAGQTRPTTANQPNSRPGFFNGFGGSLLGGLMVGGLIGMLMGGGFGGAAGFLGLIVQMLLIGGLIMLAMRFLGRGQQTAYAGPAAVMDHQESYLKTVLGFLGVTDIEIVRAEGLNLSPDSKIEAISEAERTISGRANLRLVG